MIVVYVFVFLNSSSEKAFDVFYQIIKFENNKWNWIDIYNKQENLDTINEICKIYAIYNQGTAHEKIFSIMKEINFTKNKSETAIERFTKQEKEVLNALIDSLICNKFKKYFRHNIAISKVV